MNLSDIENLKLKKHGRKLDNTALEFVASVLCEYAFGVLQYDKKDSAVFSTIIKYLADRISSKKLIEELSHIDEFASFVAFFPPLLTTEYNYIAWQSFMDQSTWTVEGDANIFVFNQQSFRIPQYILCIYKKENAVYAQRYKLAETGQGYYQNIGTGEYQRIIGQEEELPGSDTLAPAVAAIGQTIQISDEAFFDISEIIKRADAEQRDAICSDIDRNLVILAGAGSGKTRTLVCRLAYLHLVKGIPLDKIMLLTFTNSAANEMRKRSIELMEPIYAQFNSMEKPHVNARTIDSFVIGIVDTYFAQLGFESHPIKYLDDNIEVRREKQRLLEEIIEENGLQGIFKYYYDAKTGKPNAQFEWLLKNLMDYACGLPINAAGFDILLKRYLDKQRERGIVMGFTEASLFVRDALYSDNSPLKEILEKRYSCILIDEFQDVSVLQNSIFAPFYDTSVNFTFVGDDDQSIYYWRGSDNSIIQNLLDRPNVKTCYLLTNYRNNPNIVLAGNAVLSTIQNRAKASKPIKPYRESGPKIRITKYNEKYTNLAAEVARLVTEGVIPEEISILARSRSEVSRIALALSAANVPVAHESLNIEADDGYLLLKSILCILSNTKVTESIKEIQRIVDAQDITERSIYKIICGESSVFDTPERLEPIKLLADEIRLSPISGLANAVDRFLIKMPDISDDLGLNFYDDYVTESFENFCINNSAPWPITQMQLKDLFKSFEDTSSNERRRNAALSGGVKISTIHAAKGLEYDVVIITSLSEGVYPSTAQIEKVYSTRTAQLQTLSESKGAYQALKRTMSESAFFAMLNACKSPYFSSQEKELLSSFQDELYDIKGGILSLSADGIENYLDAYRYYIVPLERQYKNDISEIKRLTIVDKTAYETLRDHLYLSNKEGEDVRNRDSLQQDLEEIKQRLSIDQKKQDRLNMREKQFSELISPLKKFFNMCTTATGLLADIEKADEVSALKEALEREREQRINEERRLFYVAITRARDILYLCYDEASAPSEFIKLIPEELKAPHIMMTVEEENEYIRLSNLLHFETARASIDEQKVDNAVDELLTLDSFNTYTKSKSAEFFEKHPVFGHLTDDAKSYMEKALGLLFLEDLVGGDFQTEFAHNVQRMAESLLFEYAGKTAMPFKIDSDEMVMAHEISDDIRRIAKRCITDKPSPSYILKLVSEPDRYNEDLKKLKSSGIMHYLIRSGRYKMPKPVLDSWEHMNTLKSPDDFLVSVLDLANIRNALIHDKMKDTWPEDSVPLIIKDAEILINNCQY